ncbi:hypothetical protein PBY51_015437 [Eleginops maclovinus]|uniref:Uncharacterized protein n=1 Tax=Eleginops maclovinus TaxID=56733 RepID=A0AAN7X2M8_ELEMC|nr:hypothetical protein PBY51_015437 [Eleginops maclovinus]
MVSLGCQKAYVKNLILRYPVVLCIGKDTVSSKLDYLLKGGITMKQILDKPKALAYSTQNITGRLEVLKRVGYDFQRNGINVLDFSRKRFVAEMEKLDA